MTAERSVRGHFASSRMARPHCAVSPGGHSVTAAPTAQRHTKRAQAAVLPAVVVLLLFVHYNGGGLRWRRWVVAHGLLLLRGRVVAALGRHLEPWLGRGVVLVLLGVAHGRAGWGSTQLSGSVSGWRSWIPSRRTSEPTSHCGGNRPWQ